MAQKHIVFLFQRPPLGTIGYTEGLRAAVGMIAGVDEHSVELIYLGDGVYFALKGVARGDAVRHLAALAAQGYRPKVERESLVQRNIPEKDLASDTEVIPRREVLQSLRRADATMDF
ncbi:MAG: DsrE family protein [Chloroflexi bacterium]|nr:DsrE family protein [Chloroflexota bacterium]